MLLKDAAVRTEVRRRRLALGEKLGSALGAELRALSVLYSTTRTVHFKTPLVKSDELTTSRDSPKVALNHGTSCGQVQQNIDKTGVAA
jgi:hypothetical protein